jgi:precorrin-2 dehydrogenase / sirohydrochlorin ferrochelatase
VIPIHLDPAQLRIGLIGNGPLVLRRLLWLRDRGCEPLIWADAPEAELSLAAGPHLHPHLPDDSELAALHVIWVADLNEDVSATLAARARALKVIVNVEDVLPLCDFHTPAIVQRGKLTLSIGTGGASPAVAGAVRAIATAALPAVWEDVLETVASQRDDLRAQGATPREVIAASKAYLNGPDIRTQIAPCGRSECVLLDDVSR